MENRNCCWLINSINWVTFSQTFRTQVIDTKLKLLIFSNCQNDLTSTLLAPFFKPYYYANPQKLYDDSVYMPPATFIGNFFASAWATYTISHCYCYDRLNNPCEYPKVSRPYNLSSEEGFFVGSLRKGCVYTFDLEVSCAGGPPTSYSGHGPNLHTSESFSTIFQHIFVFCKLFA